MMNSRGMGKGIMTMMNRLDALRILINYKLHRNLEKILARKLEQLELLKREKELELLRIKIDIMELQDAVDDISGTNTTQQSYEYGWKGNNR
jgi:hypothetical protein